MSEIKNIMSLKMTQVYTKSKYEKYFITQNIQTFVITECIFNVRVHSATMLTKYLSSPIRTYTELTKSK